MRVEYISSCDDMLLADYDDKQENMVSQTSAETVDDSFLVCLNQLISIIFIFSGGFFEFLIHIF